MVNYFFEDVEFNLANQTKITDWIATVINTYGVEKQTINYIFCSDKYLLEINKKHLKHDYYTDVITFDMRDAETQPIEADVFISIDRVKANSKKLEIAMEKELLRVIIHGLLHLMGFKDKTTLEAQEMRAEEEKCLFLWT